MNPLNIHDFGSTFERIEGEVKKAFLGHDDVLRALLVAIVIRGHVLLEGVPGVGKTLLVRTLARALGCTFRRIQFTPDLMPSDVMGSTTYSEATSQFEFRPGPVFTQLLLADEVNRAPAKTQSAMLEAMQEHAVTVDGVTHPLPEPFFVLATQNPIESAGTYPLPEAQLDRFLFKLDIGHPPPDVEIELLRHVRAGFDAANLDTAEVETVTGPAELDAMRRTAGTVRIVDPVLEYITELVGNSRRHSAVQVGASPRAGIALLRAARVEAAADGRDFVVPDDVKRNAVFVLRHRILLQPDAEIEGVTTDEVVESVLGSTDVPGMGELEPATDASATAPGWDEAADASRGGE